MSWMAKTLFIFFFLSFSLVIAEESGKILEINSSDKKAVLVELFTSESCSSCPPAEKWINKLKGSKGLWKEYIPIEFHVDYWNHLHWKDKYSKKEFSQRQRSYHQKLKEGVYTPQVILSGKNERGWRRKNVFNILPEKKIRTGKIKSKINLLNGMAIIEFEPKGKRLESLSCHVAFLAGDIKTNVKSGENSGRNLSHEFVVIEFAEAELRQDDKKKLCHLSVNLSNYNQYRSKSVAVWISDIKSGEVIQAAGAWVK